LSKEVTLQGLSLEGDRLTWLGHASFLLRLAGKTIVTDPFLSDHASPVPPLGPKRFVPPALRADEVPPIDLLLLTHNHYDHLDLPSLDALPLAPGARAVVPLGLRHYVANRGFADVAEMDWHDEVMIDGLAVMALPAIHMSKRGLFDRNQTLWTSYGLRSQRRRVYVAGDTAYGPVFKQMAPALGGFDLGLVPIGAYEPRLLMRGVHTTPEEAVAIGRDLGIKRLVAKHWGTIQLTDEPLFEPPGRFRTAAAAAGYADDDVWVMKIGETRAV
jgi:L-ascorbate metabolism protein UlaG (beta-lactamase superfamily)